MITLVIGAASSGKSEWAELLATRSPQPIIYIATGVSDPNDPQWQAKIQRHRERRPDSWNALEVPIDLAQAISDLQSTKPDNYLLIDSLGTWLANLLDRDEEQWAAIEQEFLATLQASKLEITLVAEEVGWGVVPAYELGRVFRDRLGKLSRKVGAISDRVFLVVGGHAIDIKKLGERLPFN
ncbi:adenosylcobinamide-phosphate guanylyltransferase, adenosylcobinamide kinase [Thalassoporum mexicanum PCC 7367]|uniref:bifunctional adenosylcobinamide kinase/adenosylcobinamide-phosphate guanylyltransferase n=1 Tax=Thalassoporum mexicanum TaxID=3457544 RepID=UPI00029F97AC|nr:bifunctional adenosylcobinamide kinase/adenosylcobinamide-phosphate guanylyltransferase [Pseudanabaena sp. PCC 7367]AFY71313.1 adenosylcobinamide-phosphate guanylyltransferase, adenosylcobinamide kinase [Pseudanabaena sp. PCC 7367]